MATRRVTLVPHTHWDREWYEPFEVFRAHLLEMLDEALGLLEKDPRLHFTLDGQVALVDDYLELRPGAEARIRRLVEEGRLYVGPWYTLADTLLTDGESVIRNLAMGVRRAEELGGAMRVGYLPDQFGHAAQLPQLFGLFGIQSAVLWRGIGPGRPPHTFRWVGPDGSAVTALWLQDGYATGRMLPSDPEGFAAAVERTLERLEGWLGDHPLLLPIGDDHVRLAAWVPDAAEQLLARRPEVEVVTAGYPHLLAQVEEPEHTVEGELRSSAFAPVLAGVASARIREKQAAFAATTLLLRYAEPLCAWAAMAGVEPPRALLERAWRQLLLNHAHDSAAGCGVDVAHEDVQARYRWARQIAEVVRDQAMSSLRVEQADGTPAELVVFCPGPGAASFVVEAEVSRALSPPLVSRGPDGLARPVQLLGESEEPPLFEGEFGPAELAGFVQGLDPATPLFGRYLTSIDTRGDGDKRLRLDVALGEAPASSTRLAEDQRRVMGLLAGAERIRVVVHGSGLTRPVLLSAGPAAALSLVPLTVESGLRSPEAPVVAADESGTLVSGSLKVVPQADGTLLLADPAWGKGAVRVNDLVDEGDRGDLYHFEGAAGPALRPRDAQIVVLEKGPLRARLRIDQVFELPVGLAADRRGRAAETLRTSVTTEVTLLAGSRCVELRTRLENLAKDHRLRSLVHLPFSPTRIEAEQGLAVIERPMDPSVLGAGVERPAATGPHHAFVAVTDGTLGVALFSRGLPEHEVVRVEGEAPALALTLLRSVGWLARGDLSCIDHAAGPMVPTPGAQELGTHVLEYGIYLHQGDWERGGVLGEARRYAAPPVVFAPRGSGAVPAARSLVAAAPEHVVVVAAYPGREGLVVRLLNASLRESEACLELARPVAEVLEIDPVERPLGCPRELRRDGERVCFRLTPWQLSTMLIRWQ